MAQMIREAGNLPTLRCSIGFEGRKPVMVTRPFMGAEPLGEVLRVPLREVLRFSSDTYGRWGDYDEPPFIDITRQASILGEMIPDDAPIWLQVERDSMRAAIFPWESVVLYETQRRALRIPNFLRNPVVPRARAQMVICMPESGVGGPFDRPQTIRNLLRTVRQALKGSKTTLAVKIFVAPETGDELEGEVLSNDRITVDLVPYDGAEDRPGFDDGIRNPWLRWMVGALRGERIDAVHFICPGLLSMDSGALLLAGTPIKRGGPKQSVGVDELTAFYDRLGCTIMGFTPYGDLARREGVQALAYELGWSRPGPIIVGNAVQDIGLFYDAILTGRGLSPHFGRNPGSCTIHPDLVGPSEGDVMASVAEAHDMNDAAREFAMDVSRAEGPTRGGWLGLPDGPALGGGDVPGPRKKTLAETIILNERARISAVAPRTKLQKAQDVGAARALDFLQGVLER